METSVASVPRIANQVVIVPIDAIVGTVGFDVIGLTITTA
jgi:hypothetical protein